MPVKIIKPPTMDTFISARNQNTFNSVACKYKSKDLFIGKLINVHRTLLKFDLSSIPQSINITNSLLHIFLCENYFPDIYKSIGIFQIVSKWSNKHTSCIKQPLYSQFPIDVINIQNEDNTFLSFNITTLVKNWSTNHSVNLGVMLKTLDETNNSLLRFWSSHFMDSQYWPFLEIYFDDYLCPDKPYLPLDIQSKVITQNEITNTRPINILLFNYSYLIVNNGKYPAKVHLQISCDSIHWQSESSIKKVIPGEVVSCIPNTIAKYARLCYQSQDVDKHTELTVYIQGHSC